jgi:hypothetical protein
MKKLEDIPKANIFKVPDGYFDMLPSIIQARVAKKETHWQPVFKYSLRYALPMLAVAVGIFWFTRSGNEPSSSEQMLASINSTDLIEYIQESEMSTDDLLDNIDYAQVNVDSLDLYESDLQLNDKDLNEVENELETEI